MKRRIAAVVNPRAGGGRAARAWPALAERIAPDATRFTEYPGHGILLARELVEQGYDVVVAVGGDGAIGEVANGFLRDDRPVREDAVLAIVPFGTGGDFRRTLGIPDVETAVRVIAAGRPRRIDMGKAEYRAVSGEPRERYFINLTSFGMGGEVAARAKNPLSRWSGKAAFLYATGVVFLGYRAPRVTLRLDGEAPREYTIMNIAAGNGRYHGGGMHVCPRALLDDGLLDVTVVEDLGVFRAVKDLPVLYSDNVYAHPKVHHFRATRLRADSSARVSIEVDGEPLGTLPLEIGVLPRVINVLAG
jgi:YegS/Rv2252/BmrU family lipid kinase